MVCAGSAAVDAGYERVRGGSGEVCEVAEDAFCHWGAADVAEADEEDGDGFVTFFWHCGRELGVGLGGDEEDVVAKQEGDGMPRWLYVYFIMSEGGCGVMLILFLSMMLWWDRTR